MEFHIRLKELRQKAGEKQEEVANAVGCATRQYQRFEKGEQKPGFDNLWKLADHFGVTIDYLVGPPPSDSLILRGIRYEPPISPRLQS